MAPNEDGWSWPDDLDAALAAPHHHTVLFENDRVRVLEAVVESGETVPLHTHRWPAVQYLTTIAAAAAPSTRSSSS